MQLNTAKIIILSCLPSVLQESLNKIKSSPIGYRLARGVFWSMAGSIISRGLMMCSMIIVARILGKTVFGELGMIQSTVGMFGTFAGFGMGVTATKFVAQYRRSDPERAARIISLSGLFAFLTGSVLSVSLFVFSPWLAVHTISAPHLDAVLRVSVLVLFISAINGAQTGALAGFESFKSIAYVNLCVGFISFPLLIGGAWFGGLHGTVWAMVINLIFNWLLNHICLRKELQKYCIPFSFRNCFEEISILWKFSFPAVLCASMVGPVNWICNAMLVNSPNGYDELGVYNAANQWFTLLMFLPGLLGSVVMPVLSERLSQKDIYHSSRTLVYAIKINAIIVFPLLLILCVSSPYVMRLYGEGFKSGWQTLVVVLLTTGLLCMQTPVGQFLTASGKMWLGFFMNVGWAFTFIFFTEKFSCKGSLGIALARLIAYAAHSLWVYLYLYLFLLRNNGVKDEC